MTNVVQTDTADKQSKWNHLDINKRTYDAILDYLDKCRSDAAAMNDGDMIVRINRAALAFEAPLDMRVFSDAFTQWHLDKMKKEIDDQIQEIQKRKREMIEQ